VKNITVAVADEVYRSARIRAAERGVSVSALVAEFLTGLAGRTAEFSELEARQAALRATLGTFRAGDRLGRDQIHSRALR
jgi:plasmid stability protein